jgi:hypothetical protein
MKLQHGLGYTAVENRIQLRDACADLVEMYIEQPEVFTARKISNSTASSSQAWRKVTATTK